MLQLKMKRDMIKNIADIISLDKTLKIDEKIIGECENNHYYECGHSLYKCKGCELFVCGYCISGNKNICVICKIGKTPERWCKFCPSEVQYFMCHYCENILKMCYNCYESDESEDGYSVEQMGPNDKFMVCEKCQ